MKKREIGLYGTCFGEDLSKIQRFEDLGIEEARGEVLAAQQLWFHGYL